MKKLLITIAIMLTVSCSTDDAPSQESLLPPITMTGENTFGCLIEGRFFKPRDGTGTFNSEDRGLQTRTTELINVELNARDFKSRKSSTLLLHIEELRDLEEGIYQVNPSNGLRGIDGNNNTYIHSTIWDSSSNSYQTYLSFEGSGFIEITKIEPSNSQGLIYSGTFETRLINSSNVTDTILITLGRFDINTFTLLNEEFD